MHYTVSLNQLKFRASHGIYDFEKQQGNTFELSVEVIFVLPDNHQFESLSHTYNYEKIAAIASKHMQQSTDLLETVCQHIATEIKDTCNLPGLKTIILELSKEKPPLGIDSLESKVKLIFTC